MVKQGSSWKTAVASVGEQFSASLLDQLDAFNFTADAEVWCITETAWPGRRRRRYSLWMLKDQFVCQTGYTIETLSRQFFETMMLTGDVFFTATEAELLHEIKAMADAIYKVWQPGATMRDYLPEHLHQRLLAYEKGVAVACCPLASTSST